MDVANLAVAQKYLPTAPEALSPMWPPSPPLALRLPALHVRHSRARDARLVPGSARDSARSPSAIDHDMACHFGTSNSPHSSLALTHTGAQAADPDFHDGTRLSNIDFLFGSERRFFCVPGQAAQQATFST